MMHTTFIPRADLRPWMEKLAETRVVFAPARDGAAVTFRPLAPGREFDPDAVSALSPKEIVFPQTETLFTYKRASAPGEVEARFEITETTPKEKAVVFGARPCGAGGLSVFDQVFDCEAMRDAYYATRRANTVFVVTACTKPAPTCFCNSVGSGPGDATGADVMLYPFEDGFVAEAVTERGEKLPGLDDFAPAGDREAKAKALVQNALEDMGGPLDFSDVPEKFKAVFDDMEFWEKQSAACLSCGACAYLCPTCHCFNITDEGAENAGGRIRTWDNCMSPVFTLEGSGHNPRPTKAHRLRNRVGHKFSYFPELHAGLFACRGCGRCITACPSSMDIRSIAKAIQEYDK